MDIFNEIQDLINSFKGVSASLNTDTSFEELGFDSLDVVDLMMQIEEKFDISFPDDLEVKNLGGLAEKIKELKK